MSKILNKIKSIMPSKRKLIQLYTALLYNANIKGFFNGRIYKGPTKNICTPGLNCYSCPGAGGACPLGSLQNSLNQADKSALFYVLGCLMLYGILLGRFICGFLCPFGFIQELLFKIKTPKLKKSKLTRVLSYLKYVILVFLVVVVPILYGLRNVPLPGFCKYICPAGTLEGAMGLLQNSVNSGMLADLGPLFTWKFALMVSFILASIFIFRFFCRFFCPLGAIYGLFNKFSVFGIKLEKSKCVDCGLCTSKCKMDIKHVADHECISCGECIEVCPTKAISWKGSKIILPPNEIEGVTPETTEEERAELEAAHDIKVAKINKRNKILKYVVGFVMVAVLAGALVYYNFIDKVPETPPIVDDGGAGDDVNVGNEVGDLCPSYDIPLFDETGLLGDDVTFNPAENEGKITIINFWGTWCSGCIHELPYFDRIASEYADEVTVIALHTHMDFDTAADYVDENYHDSNILFGKDSPIDANDPYSSDYYFTVLGGTDAYPITIVLNEDGEIIHSILAAVTYEQLKEIVDTELSN